MTDPETKPAERPMAESYEWAGDREDRRFKTEPTGTWVWCDGTDETRCDHAEGFVTANREEAVPQLRRELLRVVAERDAARKELESWEEREAACCPEDVGFEEYIAALEKRADRFRALAGKGIKASAEAGLILEALRLAVIDELAPEIMRAIEPALEMVRSVVADPDGVKARAELEEMRAKVREADSLLTLAKQARPLTDDENEWALDLIRRYRTWKAERGEHCPPGPAEAGEGSLEPEPRYPCQECGALRTKAEGGTTFTVCDDCWDRLHPNNPATKRPETGPMKFGNDWRGVFIRGDNAFAWLIALSCLIRRSEPLSLQEVQVKGLCELLEHADERNPAPWIQEAVLTQPAPEDLSWPTAPGEQSPPAPPQDPETGLPAGVDESRISSGTWCDYDAVLVRGDVTAEQAEQIARREFLVEAETYTPYIHPSTRWRTVPDSTGEHGSQWLPWMSGRGSFAARLIVEQEYPEHMRASDLPRPASPEPPGTEEP